MSDSDRTQALLEEIRDLQKEHLNAYREQTAKSLLLAEESVARQRSAVQFYEKVVFGAAILVLTVLAFSWFLA